MPQVNFGLSQKMIDELDELRWYVRAESRTALARELFGLFAPTLNPTALARFLYRYFSNQIDDVMAEIVRENEETKSEP